MAFAACFLLAPGTTSLGVAAPTVGKALSHQSSIKKVHHRLTHRSVWWQGQCAGVFSIGVFPGNSGCVELPSELASTVLSELDVQRPVTKAMPRPLQCLQMASSGVLSTLLTLLCTSFFFNVHEGRKRQV